MNDPDGATGRDGLARELRALVLLALDRLEPLLERVRDAPAAPTSCPECGASMVAAGTTRPAPRRSVQHVPIERPPAAPTARRVQHVPIARQPLEAPC